MKKPMYRRKVYRAGRTVEIEETFPTQYGDGLTRAKRKVNGPGTRLDVENYNHELAVRRLTRLLNENFVPYDWWLTLTYEKSNRPKTVEEAKNQVSKFVLQLKKLYKKKGIEFKYVKSIPAIGEKGAVHHHLVIPQGVSQREISALWKETIRAGPRARPPDFTPLYEDEEYSALAAYIVGQKDDSEEYAELEEKYGTFKPAEKNVKKWTCSHNLRKPKEEPPEIIEDIKWQEPPMPPPGYYIDTDSIRAGTNPVTGRPYLFYRMVRMRSSFECWDDNGKKLSGREAIRYFRKHNKKYIKENWEKIAPEGEVILKGVKQNE